MITKCNQSYVNKVKNGRIHSEVKENNNLVLTDAEQRCYDAATRFLSTPDLPTSDFGEQDLYYIHLLKFLVVPKEKIYKLYNHMSKRKISQKLMRKNIDIGYFNSELLGIPKKDYLDLIIEFI